MLDFEQGAISLNPEDRLEGEVIGSLATWAAEFEDLERLDLAYTVIKALLGYVHRTQPPYVVAEWCENTASILDEQASLLKEVLAEERKKLLH